MSHVILACVIADSARTEVKSPKSLPRRLRVGYERWFPLPSPPQLPPPPHSSGAAVELHLAFQLPLPHLLGPVCPAFAAVPAPAVR